jgi:ribonuclease HI
VSLDPRAVHIYTDGSCYGNPGGDSGCAAIVRFPDELGLPDEQIVDFGCSESSINRMELTACVKALDWVCDNAPWENVTRVLVITDSQYITQNIFRAHGWKKNGWRNAHGEWKFNSDLWDKMLKLQAKIYRRGIRPEFVWQRGKKSELGKKVDQAAKVAARRGGIDTDTGYKPGAVARSMVKGSSAQRFQAAGQVLVVRPYAKKPLRKYGDRISFNIFDEATRSYAGKFYAFASAALSFELHRGNGHRVKFNSDAMFPQFLDRIEGVDLPKPTRKKRGSIEAVSLP